LYSLPPPSLDHPASRILAQGSYNSYSDIKFKLMKLFADFAFRLTDGAGSRPLFIDVGAILGTYTQFAALQRQDVIAFEPDRSNMHHISRSVITNGVSARVDMVPRPCWFALGTSK
jgi:hypothetical protein